MNTRKVYLTLLISSLSALSLNQKNVQAKEAHRAPVRVTYEGEAPLTDKELRSKIVKSIEELEAAERKFYRTELGVQMKKARDKAQQGWDKVKETTRHAYEETKDKAQEAYAEAQHKTRGIIPKIKETVKNLAHKVGIGKRKIKNKKDEVVNKAKQEWEDTKKKAKQNKSYQELKDTKYRSKRLLKQYLDKGGNINDLYASLPLNWQERVRRMAENK